MFFPPAQASLTSTYIVVLSVVGERLAERLRNRFYESGLSPAWDPRLPPTQPTRLAPVARTHHHQSLITRAVLHQDVAFFDSHRSGEIVDRLAADVQEFKVSTP